MKCPKCRYASFPYLENCPKCGFVLAEQRAALGIYAMRPDPPDLWLAYQAANMEVGGGLLTAPISPPGLDLGPLEGIDLEGSQVEPGGAETDELEESTSAPDEPDSDRLSTQDMIVPQNLDLHQHGDITLALENEADLEDESPLSNQAPEELTDARQVYELDVDEELGGLTLGQVTDEEEADEDDEEAVEYTLEIEEDIEFEVERLELEQDEAGEDADDDDR